MPGVSWHVLDVPSWQEPGSLLNVVTHSLVAHLAGLAVDARPHVRRCLHICSLHARRGTHGTVHIHPAGCGGQRHPQRHLGSRGDHPPQYSTNVLLCAAGCTHYAGRPPTRQFPPHERPRAGELAVRSPAAACSGGCRTTTTGQCARRTTFSATLPTMIFSRRLVMPWLPMTIRLTR